MITTPKFILMLYVGLGLTATACTFSTPLRTPIGETGDEVGNGNGNAIGAPVSCPPADLLDAAICVCDDFSDVGSLEVVQGPSGTPFVGVNGHVQFVSRSTIAGDLLAYGSSSTIADLDIGGSLITAGNASALGTLKVGGDLASGGDVEVVGELSVGGSLRVAGQENLVGSTQIANRDAFTGANQPCACGGNAFFDVQAAVAAAKIDNDNQAAGLEDTFESVGDANVRLETGSYYLASASIIGSSDIRVAGNVSLFVEGDLNAIGASNLSFEPGASLDLFVAGSVAAVGEITIGSVQDPQSFRLYVGGADAVVVNVGDQAFYGSIYAPRAVVEFIGDTRIVGSIFAKTISGVGALQVAYGSPVSLEPNSCEEPPTPPSSTEPPELDDPAQDDVGERID